MYTLDFISFGVHPPFTKMHENEGEGLIQMLVKSDRDMILTDQGFHLKEDRYKQFVEAVYRQYLQ